MRYLNIEVVLGLVALAQLAAWSLHTQLPPLWYAVVPLATWALYTLDRIIDSGDASGVPQTGRHTFHARHRRGLLLAACGAIVLAVVVAVIAFPLRYWLAAVILGCATLSHLLLQRSRSPHMAVLKDVNVATTFTLAAWAIPFADASSSIIRSMSWLPLFLLTLELVMVDVILLSRLDAEDDARHGRPSIAVVLGDRHALWLAQALAVVCVLASAWWMMASHAFVLGGSLMVMSIAYLWLARWRGSDIDRTRLYLELVLSFPLLVLPFL